MSSAWPKLNELGQSYDDLDPEDELTQELRNKAADQLTKLSELFNNNQQSTIDRTANMLQKQQNVVRLISLIKNKLKIRLALFYHKRFPTNSQ